MRFGKTATRWLTALFLILQLAIAQAASYVYDANGRLRAVTSSTGATSSYTYDKLGNLTGVTSVAAGQLAIFAFTPNRGPVGSTVTLYGQGFSTTPSADIVKFNGVTGTVAAGATATKLTVTVPGGATTGTVSITVSSMTATSADVFTVTTDGAGLPPTIALFTPALANPGTAVTVTGNQFITSAGPTLAGVSQITASVTPASNTQLTFPVPTPTGSGPVSVITPYGTAESATPLIVLPSSIPVASIAASATLTVGGTPQSLNIGTAGKSAVVVFQGGAGQWLSLQCTSLATSPTQNVNVSLIGPSGIDLQDSALTGYVMSVHLPELPGIGTYTLIFTPASGGTAQFTVALEQDALITTTATTNIATSTAGQTKRVIFNDVVGQFEGLDAVSSSVSPTGLNIYQDAYGPIGEKWTPSPAQYLSHFLNFPQPTESGVGYGIYLADIGATFTLGLTASVNPTAALTVNASASSKSIPYAYENAYFTFPGTMGQNISIAFNNITPTAGGFLYFSVFAPDGTLYGYDYTSGTTLHLALNNLTQTGTYQIVVYNESAPTTFGVNVSTDASGSLTPGSPATLNLAKPGQVARYTFNGSAGAYYGLQLAVQSTTPSGDALSLRVLDPNGSAINGGTLQTTSTGFLNLAALTTPGTYTVQVEGTGADTSTSKLTLYANPVGVVAVGGSAVTESAPVAGENIYYTLSGLAGQSVSFAFTNITTTPGGGYVYTNVYDPYGGYYGAVYCYTPCHQAFSNLPFSGNYVFAVLPSGGSQTTAVATTAQVSADVVAALTLNTPYAVNLSNPGQVARLTFSGGVGQYFGLSLTGIGTIPSGGNIALRVYQSNGSVGPGIASTQSASDTFFNLPVLPQTDTYTVQVEADGADTATAQLTLMANPVGTVVINSTGVTESTTVGGEYVYVTFSGNTAQSVTLNFTAVTTTPSGGYLVYDIYSPSGSLWLEHLCSSVTCSDPLGSLPENGSFLMLVRPSSSSTKVSFTSAVTSP